QDRNQFYASYLSHYITIFALVKHISRFINNSRDFMDNASAITAVIWDNIGASLDHWPGIGDGRGGWKISIWYFVPESMSGNSRRM
ncbi:MAG: hypothetical protein OXD36_15795, partial [Rhodobacter sp.]|nr:hypothetical protein [Rhodobacter sp.]